MAFRHTPEMGEISGFGDSYEKACQDMLEAGVIWLTENAGKRDIKTSHFEGVFGLLQIDGSDGKELEKAVLSACPDCSGAMHHAVMNRLMFIAKNGWDAYVAESKKRNAA